MNYRPCYYDNWQCDDCDGQHATCIQLIAADDPPDNDPQA